MSIERFRLLAATIAAHPDKTVIGRTRLQKEIKLLQRLGLPTDYQFKIHLFGPYSEGLQAEIGLLKRIGAVEEERLSSGTEDRIYYTFQATNQVPDGDIELVADFQDAIQKMSQETSDTLELAATYDAFRERGLAPTEAREALRRKKPDKCTKESEKIAIQLLKNLGLPTE